MNASVDDLSKPDCTTPSSHRSLHVATHSMISKSVMIVDNKRTLHQV